MGASTLLELDQRTVAILGMQEQYRLAVGTELGLAIAEHARTEAQKRGARRFDVRHLIAEVMDAAEPVALQEAGDRRTLAERLQQLDLGVGKGDEHDGDAMLGLRQRRRDLGAERAVAGGGLGQPRHGDGNVIETSYHRPLASP